jgi:hypothetical protein
MKAAQIFSNGLARLAGRIDQNRFRRAPAQGFDANVSRSRKKIQYLGAGQIVRKNVEKSLFDPRRGGSQALTFGDFEPPPSSLPADYTHHGRCSFIALPGNC